MIEEKKQSSWFRTDKDIKFENSFKFWFALMWQNKYIQIFLLTFVLIILGICRFDFIQETVSENFSDEGKLGAIFAICGFSLPPIICLTVVYKGFYQYFNDLKHGRSR